MSHAAIPAAIPYAELATATNFSFLRGASPPSELVEMALRLDHAGIGIADRNTVAGVVRAHAALKEWRDHATPPVTRLRDGSGPGEYIVIHSSPAIAPSEREILARRAHTFKLVVGARLSFADETPDILAYPANRAGWGRLCRLLTIGNRRADKGECQLYLDDLLENADDLLLIVMPMRGGPPRDRLHRIRKAAPDSCWLGAGMFHRGDDRRELKRLQDLAAETQMPLVALNDVLYAAPEQRDLQDVLTCIRHHTTIAAAGRLLEMHAERHLKPPEEMARLFRDAPQALREIGTILSRIDFSLDQLTYEYPDEPVPEGWDAQRWLEELVERSLPQRYPDGVSDKVRALLAEELKLIGQLHYARYFLTIHDIVRFADSRGILCQGRGSAANSAVCYVLGITAVDPADHDLLFARFISAERAEPPDIDVDFEHERREEVIQYIYGKYGRHRAGIAATVISYRPRSAIRDVGKALGLSEDITARLAATQWGSWGYDIPDRQIQQAGFDPANPMIRRAIALAIRLLGFPRHLSQHVGGFVLTRGRLDELVPVGNAAMADRTFIEWDKDDIDELGLMKVDVLALGMLTCIRKALDLLRDHKGIAYGLADVPRESAPVYDMLCNGDSVGVFQVESRAQMNMLPRLRPRQLYDLVIQVAIVRPGPIQGGMVHPYLRRRSGLDRVEYPAPSPWHGPADELKQVLGKTMGVPLFQEQAMKLAMVAAQFTDAEANRLRRAMATFRNIGTIHQFETLMVERMVERGYERDFAQRCFEQIKGFGSYGFPESHAASFAKLVYISSWLKCFHPDAFACALLNSQPMGFYAPAQIVRDAREHGVEVRDVDINSSDWDNRLELKPDGTFALRLGFRQIDGFAEADGQRLVAARARGYATVEDLSARARLHGRPLRLLADADAFRSIGLDRRNALWAVRRLPDNETLPLFAAARAAELSTEPDSHLPDMSLGEHVVADYQTLRLSLKSHPMALLRTLFRSERAASCADLAARADGAFVQLAGVVLVRQRPGNGRTIFVTLEDETGIANLVIWERTFHRFRKEVMGARLLLAEGRVQKSPEGVIHLMVERLIDRSHDLRRLTEDDSGVGEKSRADADLPNTQSGLHHPRNVRILPKSRDFH